MSKPLHEIAMLRYGILGILVNRDHLAAGELKTILQHLSSQTYLKPDGNTVRYSAKTIERWYYLFLRGGVEALTPKPRDDRGQSGIPQEIQQVLLQAKSDKPARSIKTLIRLLEEKGLVGENKITRSSVHRLLVQHGLSKRTVADAPLIERRSFEAKHAGDIWYSDVMHGIKVNTVKGIRKTYLVTFMDDASRLICYSAFYLDETVESIEHAFKEALLMRGLPKKLVIDNGPAYKAGTLRTVCARLKINLVYCRPYEPQGKGKLERWHKLVRESFLTELNDNVLQTLDELNSRLLAWVEEDYHQQLHGSLEKQTPLTRWRKDIACIQPLGNIAKDLDAYFYHRVKRTVRKDGTLRYEGHYYEVPYQLVCKTIYLVIDPYTKSAKWVESLDYQRIGEVHLLDKHTNIQRGRQRPNLHDETAHSPKEQSDNLVEMLYRKRCKKYDITGQEDI